MLKYHPRHIYICDREMKINYQKELEKIKKIIKNNPRGVTIKEISEKIGVNRNAVGKYLDVLQMEGKVDVKKFGRSHVYFPAQSVPISTMFDYSNDFMVVVRKDLTTVEINNPFIKYFSCPVSLVEVSVIFNDNVCRILFNQHF